MRYREKDEQTAVSLTATNVIRQVDCKGDQKTKTWSTQIPVMEGGKKTMRDVVTSNFQRKSSLGQVIVNPMTVKTEHRSYVPGSFSYKINGGSPCEYKQTWSADWGAVSLRGGPQPHLESSIDIARLRTLAGTEAQANIKAPEVQGLVSIAELRETIAMLRSPISGWTKFARRAQRDYWKAHRDAHKAKREIFRKYKSSRARRAKTVAAKDKIYLSMLGREAYSVGQFVGDNWLSYRYGVRPFVKDGQDIVEALLKINEKKPLRETARGFSKDAQTTEKSYALDNYDCDVVTETAVSVRAGVLYEVWGGYDTFGIHMNQIPIAAWEMIPFSFVADWFVNLGSFIEAITPNPGVTKLGSWTTTKVDRNTVTTNTHPRVSSGRTVLSYSPNVERFTTKETTRVPGVHTGLAFEPLPFTGSLGKKRILDGIALAANIFASDARPKRFN